MTTGRNSVDGTVLRWHLVIPIRILENQINELLVGPSAVLECNEHPHNITGYAPMMPPPPPTLQLARRQSPHPSKSHHQNP